jgi:hypothetical protein
MAQNQVDLVRRFNRVVTQRIGALDNVVLTEETTHASAKL